MANEHMTRGISLKRSGLVARSMRLQRMSAKRWERERKPYWMFSCVGAAVLDVFKKAADTLTDLQWRQENQHMHMPEPDSRVWEVNEYLATRFFHSSFLGS